MLIPFLVIAVLNAMMRIFLCFGDRRTTFLLYGIFIYLIAFFNSTLVGLPEIRFIPIIQLAVILLAVDRLRHLKQELRFKSLLAIAMVPVILIWTNMSLFLNSLRLCLKSETGNKIFIVGSDR